MSQITCVLLLLVCLLAVSCGQTQSKGTQGREFIIAILKPYSNGNGISLLITSNTSGKATISIPYLSINTTRSFSPDLEYKVSKDVVTTLEGRVDTTQKGIRVTTDVDVSLAVITYPTDLYEGFLALPTFMLSTRYVIASFDEDSGSYKSDFLILSKEDNTIVNVHVPNTNPYNISLNALNTYLYRRQSDLSGTVVQSNKPIAVFSGHEATSVPHHCGYRNYLVEQILPTDIFAHDFIVPPVPPKSGFVARVFSSEPNTTVNFRNSTKNETVAITVMGQFHEVLSMNEPLYIYADKPVQVILYGSCRDFNGDNFGNGIMTVVPSIHQFIGAYDFTVSGTFQNFKHYLILISKAEHLPGIRMNGQSITSFYRSYSVSYGPAYEVNVYRLQTGVYHLDQLTDETFGALLYGFDSSHSYGYMLGIQGASVAVECGMPHIPDNGRVSTANGTSYKSIARFSCNIGFEMLGSNITMCDEDGSWSTKSPTCVIRDCGQLYPPTNGVIDISNGTVFGSQATFTCKSGYILNGDQKRTCLSDGYWSESQPSCQLPGGGPTCLNCKDMTHLYLCDTVTTCSNGQVCYVETFTSNDGHVTYSSGCLDAKQCAQRRREVTKRSSECVHCCLSQLCNMNGCGSRSLPTADLRGPLCYDCAYFASLDECNTMKLCSQDEVCSIEKYDWGGMYDHYTAKCHSRQCISHKRSNNGYNVGKTLRSTPVCQNCCSTDLCNVGCNVTSHNGTGVAIVG